MNVILLLVICMEDNQKPLTNQSETRQGFCLYQPQASIPAGNYMFKFNNRNTRTRCEICSKLTIKTPERRHWRRSGVFIVNCEHISHFVLVFLLLTLDR